MFFRVRRSFVVGLARKETPLGLGLDDGGLFVRSTGARVGHLDGGRFSYRMEELWNYGRLKSARYMYGGCGART